MRCKTGRKTKLKVRSDVTSDGYRVAGVCMQRSKGCLCIFSPQACSSVRVIGNALRLRRLKVGCAAPAPPGCMVRDGAPREWMRADNLAMCAPRNAAGLGNFSRMQCGVKPALIGPPMVVAQRAASVRHPCWPAALRPGPRSC